MGSKKIADLERENKKVTEKNKQLNAELVDEKAKVMVLCELREEEELEDAPPPLRKTARAPPDSLPDLAPEKNKKRPKSMPAKMQQKEQKKEEPNVSLIQVTKEEPVEEEKVSPKHLKGKAGKGKAPPKKEKVPEKKEKLITEKVIGVKVKEEKV